MNNETLFMSHKEAKEEIENEELHCIWCNTNSENDLTLSDFDGSENEAADIFCHNCQASFSIKK